MEEKITVFTVLWCGFCKGVVDNQVFLYRTKDEANKCLKDLYYVSVLNLLETDLLNNSEQIGHVVDLCDVYDCQDGSYFYLEKGGMWERAEIDVTTV